MILGWWWRAGQALKVIDTKGCDSMAASLLLHIGEDFFHRTQVLRSAGYKVEEYRSDIAMVTWFQAGQRVDAVCITEGPVLPAEAPLAIAKRFSPVPIVLFRTANHDYLQKGWDLEVPALAPPEEWLVGIGELLAQARANIADAEALCLEARRLGDETAQVRAWSRRLREDRLRDQIRETRRTDPVRGRSAAGRSVDAEAWR